MSATARPGHRHRRSTRATLDVAGVRVLVYGALLVMGAFTVFPFAWMLLSSFKPLGEIFTSHSVLPVAPTTAAYERLFGEYNVPQAILNSFLIATSATLLQLLLTTMGGYAFAKFRFPGRNLLFGLILATMAVPFAIIFVPLFVFVRNTFGWVNTPLPLIIPWAASAFGLFLMRQFLVSFPDEILEAARIDGASELGIFRRIILPASVPALASLGLISFVGSWNSFMWPKAILQRPELETLPLLLNRLEWKKDGEIPPFDVLMAGAVITVIPTLVLVIILWRRFGQDVVSGAVKG